MYERELTVLPSEASCRGQIKLRSLINALQDTASIAVADLEGTSSELISRGYAWVLTRYEVEIIGSLPMIDEKFSIGTFHDPSHGYGTFRVFEMKNSHGAAFAWAKTSWLLLDLAAGRPVRPAVHIPEILERDTSVIDPNFREIPAFPEDAEAHEIPWTIRFHDLDVNGHVNNGQYVQMALAFAPGKDRIRRMRVEYKHQALLGDLVWDYLLKYLIKHLLFCSSLAHHHTLCLH